MRVFKSSYRDKAGKIRPTKRWYIDIADHKQIRRRISAFTDKAQSELLGRQIERLVNCRIAGEQPNQQLSRWLENIPSKLRTKFVRFGLLDSNRAAAGKSLTELVEDYHKSLLAKERTLNYIRNTIASLKKVFSQCGFRSWNNISAEMIQNYLVKLRDGGKGISYRMSNSHLKAVKAFCNWMIQAYGVDISPVKYLKTLDVKLDKRHERRALEPDEVRRLLEATRAAGKRFGTTGQQRAMLYRLAIESGLRANELRTLKVSSFDFKNYTVTVEAGYSKHRRQDVIPIRQDTAAELKEFFAGKMPNTRAFNVPHISKVAMMIKADLTDAKIPYVDAAGRYADFHSLRHSFGSLLAASGVHPKVAQVLMRHADINLTMNLYTHTLRGQESKAVESLPDLSAPSKEKQKKTGTDNEPQKNSAIYSAKCTAKQCNPLQAIAIKTRTNDNKNAVLSKSGGIKNVDIKTSQQFADFLMLS